MERFSWQVVERLTGRPSGPTVDLCLSVSQNNRYTTETEFTYYNLSFKHLFANSVNVLIVSFLQQICKYVCIKGVSELLFR